MQAQAHAEKLAEAARAERVASAAAQQAAFDTQLALRDQKFAELESELKALRDKEEDKVPEHREFRPRAADRGTMVSRKYLSEQVGYASYIVYCRIG